jgi:hypothetical protein
MPGPLIHMSNARHTAQLLLQGNYLPKTRAEGPDNINPAWSGPDVAQLGRIMLEHPNFAAIGAVGPDLFFFLPDFRDFGPLRTSTILVDVLQFLEDVYAAMDPYLSKWEKYLGPISEDTGEEMSRLTGGLSETVGDIAGELSSILITALEGFAVKHFDVLGFFSLGLDHGWDDKSYFWSDMLHYRRTADFGRALWLRAEAAKDDQLRAYALGYLTHVAADTTGHPFVNAMSGGPYRTHWTRHHLTENHIDALWYLADPGSTAPNKAPGYSQLTESALYFDIAFDDADNNAAVPRRNFPGGNTLRDNWVRKRLLDIDSKLPDSVVQLLLDGINDIFYAPGESHPLILGADGKPQADMLKNMYDLFFRLQKLMTVDGFSHEPPDPPDVFPNLDFPTPSDPAGDAAPGSSDGGSFWDDLLDFLLAVINILAYIVEVAIYLATLPWAILADLVTYPLRLGLYYALELPLFHLLKNFRAVMVMMGYFLPMADEISPSVTRIGSVAQKSFDQVLAEMGDVFGGMIDPMGEPGVGSTYRDLLYPHELVSDDYRHPWNYPVSGSEPGLTCASPYALGAGPAALFAVLDPDPDVRHGLETAADPQSADAVGGTITASKNLGSCVGFSRYELWLATRKPKQDMQPATVAMTNWNLDADRGYGYHCWDFNRDAGAESLPDPEGKPYQPPCVWPPQATDSAGNSLYDSATPQKLHWVGPGLADPGCADQEPPIK